MPMLRVVTYAEPPNDAHIGFVHLTVDDVNELFTNEELHYFENIMLPQNEHLLTEVDSCLAGFKDSGGIFPYQECFLGIDFMIDIPDDLVSLTKSMHQNYSPMLGHTQLS